MSHKERNLVWRNLARASLALGCLMLMVTLTALIKNLDEGDKTNALLRGSLAPLARAVDNDKDVRNAVAALMTVNSD